MSCCITYVVCFDGCRGAGKTTQIELLTTALEQQGKTYAVICEKKQPSFKTRIDAMYQRVPDMQKHQFTPDEVNSFVDARKTVFETVVRPLLDTKDVLIFDRYFYTSAVYQSGTNVSLERVLTENKQGGIVIPDLTVILHCNPQESLNRLSARNPARTPAEALTFLESHRRKYVEASQLCPESVSIDISGLAKEEIFKNVARQIRLQGNLNLK